MRNVSTDPLELLSGALREKRPLVLFAGQSLDSSHDAVLSSLLDHLGCTGCNAGWHAALMQGLGTSDMAWLTERFDRCVPSVTTAFILEVAWSAVFTSSIDPRFARRFETRGRQPETILSKDTIARVPRSRSRPPVYYLLGKSDETAAGERAPGTQGDLTLRLRLHATELMNRITETATIRGLVVIAGYEPDKDWLPVDTLLAPLYNAGRTVLWFGCPGKPDSTLVDEMIRQGSLIVSDSTLAGALNQLEVRGVLDVVGSVAPG